MRKHACCLSFICRERWVSRRYRGTSLTKKRTALGPYREPKPKVLGGSQGAWRFRMSEVPMLTGHSLGTFFVIHIHDPS